MDPIIISAKHQAWSVEGNYPSGGAVPVQKDTDFDFVSELFAALSGGESQTESIAADRQSVAGTDTAVGNQTLVNQPVRGGFLEMDLDIPVLYGVSQTPIATKTDSPAPSNTPVITHRHISWILIVLIVLSLIIFLRGLFLPDQPAQ